MITAITAFSVIYWQEQICLRTLFWLKPLHTLSMMHTLLLF